MTAPRPAPPLAERLARALDRFDPFEGLRLSEAAEPRPTVRTTLTNRFVPTPLRRAPGGDAVETPFVGLIGPLGPLPPFYTETALRERKRRSHGMRAFLDVFLGRIVALFVRAAEKYRLPAAVARHGAEGTAPVAAALYALIGLGFPALRNRLATADSALLPYAGLLMREARSAAGLEVMLADHLGLPVRIDPLQPCWLAIAPHEQTRMTAAGGFCHLGSDVVVGERTLDVSSRFRVVIGPVDAGTFAWLSPGSVPMLRLLELVRFYMDPGLDFDVQIVLRKEDVPDSRLAAAAPRLGWNAWVRQLPATRDADQAIFDPGTS